MADLINITEYKAFASISSTESDAKLNVVIPMVSAFVKTYCGRDFANYTATAAVEYFSIGGTTLFVSEPPVTSIDSVERKLVAGDAYTVLTDKVHYEYDIANDCVVSLETDGFPAIPNGVKITYKGGFATIPSDLKLGVISLVTYYMKGEQVPRKSLNSNQISTEYPQSQDLPPHIKRVFDLYRIIL